MRVSATGLPPSVPLCYMIDAMDVRRHLQAIGEAANRAAGEGQRAGWLAAVPPCPDWTVADLLQHLGMVHRWATAIVGEQVREPAGLDEVERTATGQIPVDDRALARWITSGARALTATLADAGDDCAAVVFLRNAPAPRAFWARRLAHETTLHAVDALAARLGRLPTTAQAAVSADLAADGIDELLTGFLPRRSSRFRSAERFDVLITPTDVGLSWLVEVGPEPPRTIRNPDRTAAPGRWSGTAAGLYLGLWNRGVDIAETGPDDALGQWRDKVRVTWS